MAMLAVEDVTSATQPRAAAAGCRVNDEYKKAWREQFPRQKVLPGRVGVAFCRPLLQGLGELQSTPTRARKRPNGRLVLAMCCSRHSSCGAIVSSGVSSLDGCSFALDNSVSCSGTTWIVAEPENSTSDSIRLDLSSQGRH